MKTRLLLFAIFLMCSPVWASYGFLQCAVNTSCGGVASCSTAAMANPLTNGSTIMVGGASQRNSGNFSASDTATNSYNDGGTNLVGGGSAGSIDVLITSNTHTTASNIVTISQTSGQLYSVWECEYSGVATSSPVDKFCSRANGSATAGTNNMTCSTGAPMSPTGSDLIFVFAAPLNGPVVAGTGYTQRATAGGGQSDQFNVSTSITPQATDQDASTDNYNLISLALKPASGATVTNPPHSNIF